MDSEVERLMRLMDGIDLSFYAQRNGHVGIPIEPINPRIKKRMKTKAFCGRSCGITTLKKR